MILNETEQRCLHELVISPGWAVARRLLEEERDWNQSQVVSELEQEKPFEAEFEAQLRYAASINRIVKLIESKAKEHDSTE